MIAVFHRYARTHLVDPVAGKVLATLELERHEPLCFSPDGASLVMAAPDGQVKIIDLRLIRSQLAKMNLDWDMPPLPPQKPYGVPQQLRLTVVTNSL